MQNKPNDFKQTNKLWLHTNFHSYQQRNLQEKEHRKLIHFIELWPWMKVKVIHTDIKV